MKNKATITVSGIFLLALLAMAGCKVGNEIISTNLAGMYEVENRPEITGLRVFNQNDSISRVFVRYEMSSLLYEKETLMDNYTAKYTISYQLYPSYESNQLLDSASFFLEDSVHYGKQKEMVFDFSAKAPYPGEYLLEVRLEDLNKETESVFPVAIYKLSKNSAQYFLPIDEQENVIFNDWISWKTRFRIMSTDPETDHLYVRYYNRNFPVARPPYSMAHDRTYEYDADEQFTVEMENGISEFLQFGREGIFHFLADTSGREGLTLYRFHDDYPQITDAARLVPPLRYLTTSKEFNHLLGAENPKVAVDSFWIKTAGNEERAVELIREYYSRVEFANQYFTSYKEGWKTDRGMLYIVFGPPQIVYRRTDIETWIYGEQGNRISLRFDFIKTINPFTDEDYSLQRKEEYKNPWFIAVDYLRR
ncbi:MAG: GWxTD domain-containing protein [Bacteroidales bacterium]